MRKIFNVSCFMFHVSCFMMLCLTQAGKVKADTDLTAYSNVIYVAPATVNPANGTEVVLSICMNNTAQIRGFQFDLYLPDGMTAMKTQKGKFVTSLNTARLPEDDEHTLTVAQQSDGAIRFLCGSQYDETFTGTSGEIATIKVSIEGLSNGKHPITLKAIKLTETDVSQFYNVPEVVTTFTVNSGTGSSDYSAYDNVIYVAPATVNLSNGTEVDLSICMNNTAKIRGFQFDLYLPDGVTAMKTQKGKFVTSLGVARLPEDDEHTLTVAEQSDGAIRFLCGSQYDETFTGTSGEIATIKVNIESRANGEYPITLKAIKLTETDVSRFYNVPEVVTMLSVNYGVEQAVAELAAAITEAEKYYNLLKDSNPDFAETMLEIINDAKATQDDPDASQSEIEASTSLVLWSIEGARLAVAKAALAAAITETEEYYNHLKDSNPDFAETMLEVISEAKAIRDDPEESLSTIESTTSVLLWVIDGAKEIVATGVNAVKAASRLAGAYYDLNGRRLSGRSTSGRLQGNKPSRAGVYINRGKKIVMK